jgi:hypothetical protein
VVIVVNAVEEVLQFINGHISDDLAKAFISFGAFALSARNLSVWIIIVVDLHPNVKSTGVIKVSVPVNATPQNTHDGMQQRTKFARIRKIYKLQNLNNNRKQRYSNIKAAFDPNKSSCHEEALSGRRKSF